MSDLIDRQAAIDALTRRINEFEGILSDIREKNVDDSVCGLCEYDCDHGLDGYANECPGFERDDCFKLKDIYRQDWLTEGLPSAQPEFPEWVEEVAEKIEKMYEKALMNMAYVRNPKAWALYEVWKEYNK